MTPVFFFTLHWLIPEGMTYISQTKLLQAPRVRLCNLCISSETPKIRVRECVYVCMCMCTPKLGMPVANLFLVLKPAHSFCVHIIGCATEGGYFIFDDISVRQEGHFKFKFSIFRIGELVIICATRNGIGLSNHYHRSHVFYLCSILSDTFQVYSPKSKLSGCSIGKCKSD